MLYTRRDFGKLALAAMPFSLALAQNAKKKINSTIKGVQLGAQTYSFRNLPLDGMIQAMVEVGLGDCEVYSPHVEPRMSREDLCKWRLTVSLDEMKEVARALREAMEDAEDLSDVLAVLENPGIPIPMSEVRKKYSL